MQLSSLTAVSPSMAATPAKPAPLARSSSEFGLIRLPCSGRGPLATAPGSHPGIPEVAPFSAEANALLNQLAENFQLEHAEAYPGIRAHHQPTSKPWVPAQEQAKQLPELAKVSRFIHFACTSEDINNLSRADVARRPRHRSAAADAPARRRHPRPGRPVRRRADAVAHPRSAGLPDYAWQGTGQRGLSPGAPDRSGSCRAAAGQISGAVGSYNAHLSAYGRRLGSQRPQIHRG